MRLRDNLKEDVVRGEAIKMLANEGFDGFSMNKLAKGSKVSVATLYIYYKDKESLLKQIGSDIGRTFMQTTLKDFSPKMSFADGLKKQWENRSDFAIKFPLEVACYEILRHSTHGDYINEESFKDFKTVMQEFTHNAIERKELIPVSIEAFWSVAYGPLYTLLRFHNEGKSIGGRKFVFNKVVMDEAFQLTIKALTP